MGQALHTPLRKIFIAHPAALRSPLKGSTQALSLADRRVNFGVMAGLAECCRLCLRLQLAAADGGATEMQVSGSLTAHITFRLRLR